MTLKRLARVAAVAMTVAVAGTALTTQPAVAATTVNYKHSQAQYDNNPGNGAAAWVWVWTSAVKAELRWQYYDGSGGTLDTGPGAGSTASLSKDVWRISLCEYWSEWDYSCSDWKS